MRRIWSKMMVVGGVWVWLWWWWWWLWWLGGGVRACDGNSDKSSGTLGVVVVSDLSPFRPGAPVQC